MLAFTHHRKTLQYVNTGITLKAAVAEKQSTNATSQRRHGILFLAFSAKAPRLASLCLKLWTVSTFLGAIRKFTHLLLRRLPGITRFPQPLQVRIHLLGRGGGRRL